LYGFKKKLFLIFEKVLKNSKPIGKNSIKRFYLATDVILGGPLDRRKKIAKI